MLVERPVMKALQDYLKGKKVVVIGEYNDGSIESMKMEDVLPRDGFHYLVDVPAVSDPDFEAAVQDMVGAIPSADQIVSAVHETQEENPDDEIAPPSTGSNNQISEQSDEESVNPSESKKTVRETVLELKDHGLTVKEIVEKTGYKYGSVYNYYNGFDKKRSKQEKLNDITPGHNADRHLCKTCRFRSKESSKNGCDYIEHNKKSRGCKIEDCNVYEKGDPDKIKTEE